MGKRFKKVLVLAFGILLCTMCTAGAKHIESIYYDYTNDLVKISGNGFEDYAGSEVAILVFNGGTKIDDYSVGNDSVIEKQAQTEINEDGTFYYEFALKEKTTNTEFTAYIKAGDVQKETAFVYRSDIVNIYNTCTATNAEVDILAQRHCLRQKELMLSGSIYTELGDGTTTPTESQIAVSTIVASQLDAIRAEAADAKEGIELLRNAILQASYIVALNENKLDLVVSDGNFKNAEDLGLTELGGTVYQLFMENTTDAGKQKVFASLTGKGYADIKDKDANVTKSAQECFLEDFAYYATISAIKNYCVEGEIVKGSGHVKGILTANASLVGLDFTNYNSVSSTTTIDDKLVSGSEWERSAVQEVLDTEVTTTAKDPTSTSSSSSSSKPSTGSVGSWSQNYSIGGLSTSTTPETTTPTFTDLGDVEWAREAIEALASKGVVSGRGDGTFAPKDNVTRAEFLTMLLNAFGMNNTGAICNFTDVATGDWFYQSVAMGTTLGFAKGYDNGAFGAKDNITRQDAVVMLNNAVTKLGRTLTPMTDSIDFTDSSDIAEYAQEAVDVFVQAGIISGMEDGTFMPKNNCTRAQAAVMIYNLMTALGLEG